MRVKYCERYDKYVSAYHCEFFNEGEKCEYYTKARWNRIKDLLADRKRPKKDIIGIVKPHRCSLMR